MTNIWSYQGEAGKRLDANIRPFTHPAGQIHFAALATDTWAWKVDLQDVVPAGEEFPEEGQIVSLFRNGQRFFRGTATKPSQEDYTMSVKVLGPWDWMEVIPLSKAITLDAASGGGGGQRATIGFPAQSLTISLGTLIDRCIALGVPMVKGTIATTFTAIPLTLNQGSCAAALSELVRLIGDMSVWFDYSGTGLPIINITRRKTGLAAGTAAAVTIDVSQMAPGFKCEANDRLRVSQVRVPYYDRALNGLRRNQEQKAGTEETGHVMLLTASGEELDTFLPNDRVDSVNIQTLASNSSAAQFLAFLNTADPVLSKLRAEYGAAWYGGTAAGAYRTQHEVAAAGTNLLFHSSTPTSGSTPNKLSLIGPVLTVNGGPVSGVKHIITNNAPIPDWFRSENGITVYDAELVCDVFVTLEWDASDYSVQPYFPGLNEFVGSCQTTRENMYNLYGSTVYDRLSHFVYRVTRPVKVIDSSYPVLSTVYRKPAYQFVAPPAGFAQGILESRNWTPYAGSIATEEEDCGGVRYLGKVVNVTGADPAFTGMRAMVQSETLDLGIGATRIALGPPARLAFKSLLDVSRANPNQQIVYL